jgi:predicted RNA-binding Zn-ribbon protein involved in translation (DUF1610 family)
LPIIVGGKGAMRNSNQCPKCRAVDILRIPGQVRGYAAFTGIPIGRILQKRIAVTRYFCASCGYSEEWVDSAADIAVIKAYYGPLQAKPVSP